MHTQRRQNFWFAISFAIAHISLCLCQVSCFLLELHNTFTIPLNYFSNHTQGQSLDSSFANTLWSKSAVRLTKLCLSKIYYRIKKSLLIDKAVVEPSLILSQTSTCKWVYYWVDLQVRACNFTKHQFFCRWF